MHLTLADCSLIEIKSTQFTPPCCWLSSLLPSLLTSLSILISASFSSTCKKQWPVFILLLQAKQLQCMLSRIYWTEPLVTFICTGRLRRTWRIWNPNFWGHFLRSKQSLILLTGRKSRDAVEEADPRFTRWWAQVLEVEGGCQSMWRTRWTLLGVSPS